jgi:transposase InsO family protein
MSHDHTTPTQPTTPPAVPQHQQRPDGGPPPQPSAWLDPSVRVTGDEEPTEQPPGDDIVIVEEEADTEPGRYPHHRRRLPYGKAYVKPTGARAPERPSSGPRPRTPNAEGQTRVQILDTWMRSGLPAGDFAPMVNVAKHTLYAWKRRFEAEGPAGLMDRPRGSPRGSRLSEITKRSILMMKKLHPDWGVDRISDLLLRTEALQASPSAIAKVLTEDGYLVEESRIERHPDKIRFFERAKPNQLWQTDLFTFVLKRQNQRVYLVAFMDDHSRYIVSYGLHASQSTALVLETLRAGIASYGTPVEVLTDNGTQYVTWRGTSQFQHECRKRGIKQVVSSPRHPETLGKIERFWGTLWKECVQSAVFTDLADARIRIGHFMDYYNFSRTHSGINGMVPSDRFFSATPAMLESLRARVAANALDLARNGVPKTPLYLAGNVGGTPVTLHGEGDRVFLSKNGQRTEVDFEPRVAVPMPPPASSATPQETVVTMPTPVAPAAVVESSWTGAQPGMDPGASALDDLTPPEESWKGGAE